MAVLLISLSIGFYAWTQDPSNGLFHSYVAAGPSGPGNTDPQSVIFAENTGTFTNDFNARLASYALGVPTDGWNLNANTTDSAVVLSKSSFDVAAASGKELFLLNEWNYYAGGVASSCANCLEFGWYLTLNGTLPTQKAYTPINDPQVVLLFRITPHNATSTYNVAFIQHTSGTAISKEALSCGTQGTDCFQDTAFLGVNGGGGCTEPNDASLSPLNFTGVSQGGSGVNNGVSTLSAGGLANGLPCSDTGYAQYHFPWLALTGNYYLGYYQLYGKAGATGVIWYRNIPGSCSGYISCAGFSVGSVYASMSITFGTQAAATVVPQPTVDTGGFFGPIIRALISIGIFIFNGILAFIGFIAPALQAALGFMETLVTTLLNFIGNALGFGNVGTDLANFLNALVNFFTNQLPGYIGDFPSYFTNFISLLAIQFPFLAPMFTIANAIILFGVNGVAQGITIFTLGLQMFLFGYGVLIWVAFFIYTGDDAIGGFFTYLGTLEALSFKILNLIAMVTNLGIDFIVHIISLIPKPVIQMNAGRLPRLPTVEANASITFPTMDFGEARNGNLVVYWLWCMGLWFVTWFESHNPAFPGSLAALFTNATFVSNIRTISSLVPLFQAMTLVSGGLLLIWFCMLPLRMAGIDVTELPLGAGLGRQTGPGPGGIKVHAGKKHLRKTIRRQLGERAEKQEAAKKEPEKPKVAEKKPDRLDRALAKAETERHLGK